MTQRLLDCGVGNTTLFIANPSLQKRLTTELTAGGNGQEISKKGCGQCLTLKKPILTDCGLPLCAQIASWWTSISALVRKSAITHGKNISWTQLASRSFFLQFVFIGDTSTEGGGKYSCRPNCLLLHQEMNAWIKALILSLKGTEPTGVLASWIYTQFQILAKIYSVIGTTITLPLSSNLAKRSRV